MIVRRICFASAALLWLGMLGALAVSEHRRHAQQANSAGYLENIFGPEAPALVRQNVLLKDPIGSEKQIGYVETSIQRTGSRDAIIGTTLEVRGSDIPPMARAALGLVVSGLGMESDKLGNLYGEFNVYINRLTGVRRIDCKGTYGLGQDVQQMELRARPRGSDKLSVSGHVGPKSIKPFDVAYDPALPFGGGLGPFQGGGKDVKVGSTWTVSNFNPVTRSTTTTTVRVEGTDVLRHGREDVPCFVMRAYSNAGPGAPGTGAAAGKAPAGSASSTAWVANVPGNRLHGQVLREQMDFVGFRLVTVLDSLTTNEDLKDTKKDGEGAKLPRKAKPPAAPAPPAGDGKSGSAQ